MCVDVHYHVQQLLAAAPGSCTQRLNESGRGAECVRELRECLRRSEICAGARKAGPGEDLGQRWRLRCIPITPAGRGSGLLADDVATAAPRSIFRPGRRCRPPAPPALSHREELMPP
ncbi:E3 Ubiquitin-Protein Ligase Uhrf2 [Manis pentadactyla]|nr:E3 Ubiquitin-Protein Ligase Uhrf2 [Manis pentadactyla]